MNHRFGNLAVQTDASTQYATVYDMDDGERPVGTLQRRRVYERGAKWTVFAASGAKVGEVELVRSALRALAEDMAD